MSISGIHGLPLEITIVGCVRLKDTEWISKQDPYVSVEYGSSRSRTRTCTDGGKNPTFQEKFVLTLIEGLRELTVSVWNSNSLSADDFIGNGRVSLQKVLSQGYDDCSWTIQDKCGRYAGEVRLILHYAYADANPGKITQAPVPPYTSPTAPPYQGYPATTAYPGKSVEPPAYPPGPTYPQSGYSTYPPSTSTYTGYPPAPASAVYPPASAGYPTCPPPAYAPQYPPPPHTSVYPPGPPAGVYPPPPY